MTSPEKLATPDSVMAMTPLYDSAMQQFPKERYPLLLWQGLVKQIEEENANLQEANRVQLAAISTAALGYWKLEQGVLPEFDSVALRDVASLYAKYEALRAEVEALATQRQGEGENRKIAQLIIDNDRAGAVKWATGLIGNFDGPSCRIDPDATSQGVAVAQPDARDAALEQAACLVECEYAADATQGRRLAQIAQHIRDLKKRGV